MNKSDKRYIRTEQAFRIAVLNLWAKQEKLTVTAVAKETHVHRKTFYLHYKTVEDIQNEIVGRLTELLRACMDGSENEKGFMVSDLFFKALLYRAMEQKTQFEAVTQKNVPEQLFALLEAPLTEELENRMYPKSVLTKTRLHYAVAQLLSGVFHTFALWTEKKEIPAVELFELLSKMTRAQMEVIYGKKVR